METARDWMCAKCSRLRGSSADENSPSAHLLSLSSQTLVPVLHMFGDTALQLLAHIAACLMDVGERCAYPHSNSVRSQPL